MSDTQAGGASVFTALREWERKNAGGGGGGGGKNKADAGRSSGKLRLGASKGIKRFHPGHRLSGQRINNIVKVKFVPNGKDSRRHIMAHLEYIQDREREQNEPERKFYGRDGERTRESVADTMLRNRGDEAAMFKIILSPKQNELNHVEYATEIMRRFEEKTGIVTDWSLVEHRNTEHHHVHIVMPGRDMDGISYRLEKEHLDLLRELANEYQYELQDLVYEREKQIEYEFGSTRDEVKLLIESSKRDRGDMKELGVLNPELDKEVQKELLPQTNWDNLYFRGQLEREMMASAYDEFKQMQPQDQAELIAKHPALYQGLAKQMQTQEINNQYFNRLQDVNPSEYERFSKDPSLDRSEAVERLKQAFPDWFDPIVEKLKEEMPGLFANYEKPAATERQIMDNLQRSNPELFPELSKQIQENQKNLFAMGYLAQNNPELYQKITEEPNLGKQQQMLAEAKKGFPEAMKEAELALAAQQPEIYKHGEDTGPTQLQIIADLAKSKPHLFPGAAAELQRVEVDKALFDKFTELYSDAPEKFENDPAAKAMILSLLRSDRPDLLKQVTANVREQQPALFTIERSETSQTEIIQGLMKEKPQLFPHLVQEMKNQEIDKAYFERAQELMPERLQKYADDPALSRGDLYEVLKSAFPDWRPGIEAELKEKMPQLFQYDMSKSNEQIFDELKKSNPELFAASQQKEETKEQDPVSAKLEEIKERLINEAYYQRGRERLHDGLQAYLAENEYDRQHIIQGFKDSFPEWLKDIEGQLKELYPVLFLKDDFATEQTKVEQKNLLEKLRYTHGERAADERASVTQEAGLLLALSSGADKLEKQIDVQEKTEHDPAKEAELEQKAEHAQLDADKFQIGHGWAGLTGIHHGAFIGEKIDLEGEAKALFEDQKELTQKMNEANEHAQLIDPKVFQLEDIAKSVEERIEEHEKEKEPDERA